jgi:hypothetical protein
MPDIGSIGLSFSRRSSVLGLMPRGSVDSRDSLFAQIGLAAARSAQMASKRLAIETAPALHLLDRS